MAVENIRIEAIAELYGHPSGNSFFVREYAEKFPHLGATYPETSDDLLIIAKPEKISLFKFLGKPCEDVLDVTNKKAYRIGLDQYPNE